MRRPSPDRRRATEIEPHTVYAELGVLQQSLFTRACTVIARGAASIVLICGGEARARAARQRSQGIAVAAEPEAEGPADTVTFSPAQQVISQLEIERSCTSPHASTRSSRPLCAVRPGSRWRSMRREVAALWDGFAAIAARASRGVETRRRPRSATAWQPRKPLVLLALHQAARLVLDRRSGGGIHPVLGRGRRGGGNPPRSLGFPARGRRVQRDDHAERARRSRTARRRSQPTAERSTELTGHRAGRRGSPRPLQLLPVRGAGPGGRARAVRRSDRLDRHRRHVVRRRPAEQLRLAVHGPDDGGASRRTPDSTGSSRRSAG